MLIRHLWLAKTLSCAAFAAGGESVGENSPLDKSLDILVALQAAAADGDNAQAARLAADLRAAAEHAGTPLASGDQVTFLVFTEDAATSVIVEGDFREKQTDRRWNLKRVRGTNVWTATFQVRSDAEFIYNVGIDGKMIHDPLCKRWITGFGKHSVGRMPDFDPWLDRVLAAEAPHGAIESFHVQPKNFETSRTIQVYLPPGYAEGRGRYPVLYVNDGPFALADGRFDAIADYLLAEGRIEPLILCFVPYGDRSEDYGHKAAAYADFLVGELVPLVDRRYRTRADRTARGVTGASMGGRISTYLALHHSDVFGICIGQSSWFEEDCVILTDLKNGPRLPVRFYYDVGVFERSVGERDLVKINTELCDILLGKGCNVVYREWPGVHCWLTWSRGIGEALPLFWPGRD